MHFMRDASPPSHHTCPSIDGDPPGADRTLLASTKEPRRPHSQEDARSHGPQRHSERFRSNMPQHTRQKRASLAGFLWRRFEVSFSASPELHNLHHCQLEQNILRIIYGRADGDNFPSDKIATEKNGAKPVVLQSAPQGHGLVNSTDSANAEIVYQCGQGQFISITIRGYVLETPVESNLMNMANSISSLACTT